MSLLVPLVGRLFDVQVLEVPVHELVDRGGGSRIAALVHLIDKPHTRSASSAAFGPAGMTSRR